MVALLRRVRQVLASFSAGELSTVLQALAGCGLRPSV